MRLQGWVQRVFITFATAAALIIAQLGGAGVERGFVALSLALAIVAMFPHYQRRLAGSLGFALLLSVTISLALRFLNDTFTYHIVWLLSAPALDPYLKIANIWAGDEGTLLLLSLLGMGCALRLSRYRGLAGPGAYLLSACFILGVLIWDPFRQTAPDSLAEMPFRGMNAHLTRVWMAVHPPLVFLSYLLILAPWGAMAEALAFGRGDWKQIAAIWSRAAWFLLSAGIAFGMWWAYEDFTYGTLWHWDPVQTSIFATWSFLTALLHTQRRYQKNGVFMVVHPLLGLLSATSIILAMAVTRNPELVSSHRYVGETSLWLLLVIAGLIGTVTFLAWILGLRRAKFRARINSERHAFLWAAILLFVVCGLTATIQIGLAYRSAYLGLPRPDDLKPFFESLASFSASQELQALRDAFAQWDIDNFGLNRWLTPVCSLIALVGGHYFLPLARRSRWVVTHGVSMSGVAVALWLHPLSAFFTGTGLTSGKTVALFPWIDFLAVSLVYLVISVCFWVLVSGRTGRTNSNQSQGRKWSYYLPVGLIHTSIMVAFAAGLVATIFDSYSQKIVDFPQALHEPITFPGGYSLRIAMVEASYPEDGAARAPGNATPFRSVAAIEWMLRADGKIIEQVSGHSVYRDDRPAYRREKGSYRLMCEMVDYRFARYLSDGTQMIHPLISRGIWRDVQIWVPAVSTRKVNGQPAPGGSGDTAVILKIFPMISWVWIGLILALSGFLWFFISEWSAMRKLAR